nr:histone-lysine n-methyltransferase, h3 lysine-9 specific dim-5 [Quercus suber]
MSRYTLPARPSRARTSHHEVSPTDALKIISHRLDQSGSEEYLLVWRLESGSITPLAESVVSWHRLEELNQCLHHVQAYIQTNTFLKANATDSAPNEPSRKRKAPGGVPSIMSRDSGLLTPLPSEVVNISRSQSPLSVRSAESIQDEPRVYNGTLDKRAGKIIARLSHHPSVAAIDVTTLPTHDMLATARRTPIKAAEQAIWNAFTSKLRDYAKKCNTVTRVENHVDRTSPSLSFEFIHTLVLREGTYRADPDAVTGCELPCRPDMGGNCGCEYTKKCACLEFAAVDEQALKRRFPDEYEKYLESQDAGIDIDTTGLPKQFPYSNPKEEHVAVTLRKHYRETRNVIYECNDHCNCGPICKSRLVQKGRRVPLTIFKTKNRGWGVYCNEDLVMGEFIDTYLGEVITCAEAERREATFGTKNKASYMWTMDKFLGEMDVTEENCFVVDGEHVGSPTRFINHSCEPNCRQYVVSYNKYDLRVYDLAFFAYVNIPQGTELTFDYKDLDEREIEDVVREESADFPCNCGSVKCRGHLCLSASGADKVTSRLESATLELGEHGNGRRIEEVKHESLVRSDSLTMDRGLLLGVAIHLTCIPSEGY